MDELLKIGNQFTSITQSDVIMGKQCLWQSFLTHDVSSDVHDRIVYPVDPILIAQIIEYAKNNRIKNSDYCRMG